MLLTVSNIVTNASDLSIGFVGSMLCLRGGGDAVSVGVGFPGVGQGKAGQKRKNRRATTRAT